MVATHSTQPVSVLADIGGTNIRFAVLRADGRIGQHEAWLTALYPGFKEALEAYIELAGLVRPLASVAVAAAGPLADGRIAMTNCPWVVAAEGLRDAAGTKTALLMNDFTAVAHALPSLTAHDLRALGGRYPQRGAPMAVVGPGTGLGISGVIPTDGDRYRALASEGGHVELAPANARELAVIFQLQQTFGHVSAERVLSGPGLENLLLALAALEGQSFKAKPQAEWIARRASEGDPLCAEAIALFTGWLGQVAGNLVLTLGATGGLYLAGGILTSWGPLFDAGLFRSRFEAKGRLRDYMTPIPTFLIEAKDIAFRGLARALQEGRAI